MISLEAEAPADVGAREALLDRAFGPGRHVKTSERLREGRSPADGLSFVARDGARLVGTLRLWHAAAVSPDGAIPMLLLGPVAVEPARQGGGIGAALMRHALARAAEAGHRAVVLVGDEPYYRRFGFSAEATGAMRLPGPYERHRFLGLELETGALRGARGLVIPTGALVAPAELAGAGAVSLRAAG